MGTPAKKRKANPDDPPSSKSSKKGTLVHHKRIRVLKSGQVGNGPILYWMSRDQRKADNWALLYAAQHAVQQGTRLAVCFNLVDEFLGAGARQFCFMLRGLQELAPQLEASNVRFHMLVGQPVQTVPKLVGELDAGLLVTDQSPLRLGKQWREGVTAAVTCPVHEVDAHNVVPVWVASDKREYAARTIRSKINGKLSEYLEEFPDIPELPAWPQEAEPVDWPALIQEARERGSAVPEVDAIKPGEAAAADALTGPKGFLSPKRLKDYAEGRNNPNKPSALSGLSPYFHFGQLAPQRAALEVRKHRAVAGKSVDAFLEEAVVRRELSDNFCFYEPDYDSISCAADWARETLQAHAGDKREYLYTREQLEKSKTHDDLWNAAQLEMVHLGKMHGYIRMYWAKKILEWTASPEEALETAIYLNDKYELDGRDPNGYVGCMWSICGIHDMGWKEREVFGKIRYMNYNGCKRKFDVSGYVQLVRSSVKRLKQSKKA